MRNTHLLEWNKTGLFSLNTISLLQTEEAPTQGLHPWRRGKAHTNSTQHRRPTSHTQHNPQNNKCWPEMVQDLWMMQLSDYTSNRLWSHPAPSSHVESPTQEAGKALSPHRKCVPGFPPLKTAQMEMPQTYLSTEGVSIDPQNTGKGAREENWWTCFRNLKV